MRALFICLVLFSFACSSSKKKEDSADRPVALSELRGKKIALQEIDGEPTQRNVVEVAIINQLKKRGSFILINKKELAKATQSVEQEMKDEMGIVKRAGADYQMKVKVLNFEANEFEGYDKVEQYDSQMEVDTGKGETTKLVKVKALRGNVRFDVTFQDVAEAQKTMRGIAEAEREVKEDESRGAIHLPPRIRFLEDLSNRAFEDFFEKYE